MKDFINWLKNNEKIGKVIVWLFIITIGLIILNITLESLGLPHYKITNESIITFESNKIFDLLSRIFICFLNFLCFILLIFRVEKIKEIIKWAVLYVMLNIIVYFCFGYLVTQIYIILFLFIFSYYYSSKNKKYLLYCLVSIIVNTIVQGIAYLFKVNIINMSELNRITRLVLGLDYFIIMAIIILVKELYLKKRGAINGVLVMVGEVQPRKEISKKNINKSN